MKNKIEILGTAYLIKRTDKKDDPKMINDDGYCDNTSKEIVVLKNLKEKDDVDCVKYPEFYEKKIFRHEIIHAFFFESGLEGYSRNEVLVEWLATQIPKIQQVFKSLEVE